MPVELEPPEHLLEEIHGYVTVLVELLENACGSEPKAGVIPTEGRLEGQGAD